MEPTSSSSSSTTTTSVKQTQQTNVVENNNNNVVDSNKTPVIVSEGQAKIIFEDSDSVFYNHAQEVNRDLSVAVIKAFERFRREAMIEEKSKKSKIVFDLICFLF